MGKERGLRRDEKGERKEKTVVGLGRNSRISGDGKSKNDEAKLAKDYKSEFLNRDLMPKNEHDHLKTHTPF